MQYKEYYKHKKPYTKMQTKTIKSNSLKTTEKNPIKTKHHKQKNTKDRTAFPTLVSI